MTWPARLREEDGIIATQLAVLMPAVLLLLMLTVQFALWAHGSHLAAAAADLAATTTATLGGDPTDGRAAAADLLARAGNLRDIDIAIATTGGSVTAHVRGTAPQLVPGIRFGVGASATASVERFTSEADR